MVEMGLRMVAEAGPMLTRILSLNIISFGKCCYRSLADGLTKYLLPLQFLSILCVCPLCNSTSPQWFPHRAWRGPRHPRGWQQEPVRRALSVPGREQPLPGAAGGRLSSDLLLSAGTPGGHQPTLQRW